MSFQVDQNNPSIPRVPSVGQFQQTSTTPPLSATKKTTKFLKLPEIISESQALQADTQPKKVLSTIPLNESMLDDSDDQKTTETEDFIEKTFAEIKKFIKEQSQDYHVEEQQQTKTQSQIPLSPREKTSPNSSLVLSNRDALTPADVLMSNPKHVFKSEKKPIALSDKTDPLDFKQSLLSNSNLKAAYDRASNEQREKIDEAIEFLDGVIPEQLFTYGKMTPKMEKEIQKLYKLSAFYLHSTMQTSNATNDTTSRLTYTYRVNLLQRSIKLYKKLADQNSKFLEKKDSTSIEQLEIQHQFRQWKINLDLRAGQLNIDAVKYGITVASTALSVMNFSVGSSFFKFIPNQLFVQVASNFFGSMSAFLKVFRITVLSYEVIQRSKQMTTLFEWMHDFNTLKASHKTADDTISIESKTKPANKPTITTRDEKSFVKSQLLKFIENKPFQETVSKLKKMGIELDPSITSRETLEQQISEEDFLNPNSISNQYNNFLKQIDVLDKCINEARNLYDKRIAIQKKKIFITRPRLPELKPSIKNALFQNFEKSIQKIKYELIKNPNQEINYLLEEPWIEETTVLNKTELRQAILNDDKVELAKVFEHWFEKQTDEDLLTFHVDHQNTLNVVCRVATGKLISTKLSLERLLGNFKLNATAIYLGTALISLLICGTLTTIGFLAAPLPILGLLVALCVFGSGLVTVGLISASLYLEHKNAPTSLRSSLKGLPVKILFKKIGRAIASYRHQKKAKELISIAIHSNLKASEIFQERTSISNKGISKKKRELLDKVDKIRVECKKREEKLIKWNNRLDKSLKENAENVWVDFQKKLKIYKAPPKNISDALSQLGAAISQMDFDLMDKDFQYFLKVQIGIDLEKIENEMKKNPQEARNKFEDDMKKYLAKADADFSSFAKQQDKLFKENYFSNNN